MRKIFQNRKRNKENKKSGNGNNNPLYQLVFIKLIDKVI